MRLVLGERQRKAEEDTRDLTGGRDESQVRERGRQGLEFFPLAFRDRDLDAAGYAVECRPASTGPKSLKKLGSYLE